MTVNHGEEGGLSLHALRLWQLEPPMVDADPQRAPDVIPRGYNQLTSAQANMEVVLGCKVNLLEFHDFLHSFGMIFASQVILTPLYRAQVMCFYYITDQVKVDPSLISTPNLLPLPSSGIVVFFD